MAIGDALGAPVEFKFKEEFAPVTCYRCGGPYSLSAGSWTDDTSMALCLADSLKQGWDLDDQMQKYLAWWQTGKYSVNGYCFDIGKTVRNALDEYTRTGNVRACPNVEDATSAKAGVFCPKPSILDYDGPKTVEDLWADEKFRLTVGVKIGSSRVMRTRPIFPQWSSKIELCYNSGICNEEQIFNWLKAAGEQCGAFDWRPKYGRFNVERI